MAPKKASHFELKKPKKAFFELIQKSKVMPHNKEKNCKFLPKFLKGSSGKIIAYTDGIEITKQVNKMALVICVNKLDISKRFMGIRTNN
jgi:hypothetical protein